MERVVPGPMTDLWIRTALGAASFAPGESIAVDGACLTVVERGGGVPGQAAPETLRRTTLGELRSGSRVEPRARAAALATASAGTWWPATSTRVREVLAARPRAARCCWRSGSRRSWRRYFIEKGSVTVDGVSLTVNTVGEDRFSVQLIPETQARTTLADRAVGERVNVEADIIGKYVARLHAAHAPRPAGSGGLTGHAPGRRVRMDDGTSPRRGGHIALVERAIGEIRNGRMVILADDEDRENEGDLVMAAEKVTPEAINFMATHGRGLICLALTEERIRQLELPLMVQDNTSPFGTAFTVSIEAARGVTTGISAADRARTIRAAVAPRPSPETWSGPATSSPCARARAACSCAPGRPRARWIWRGWRACARGRHLRGDERGRHHGAPPELRALRAEARAQDPQRRRPHPLPAAAASGW